MSLGKERDSSLMLRMTGKNVQNDEEGKMFRFLTVIIALLMFVTDYGSLGFVAAALVLAVYILLIYIFHNLAEAAEKKRKKKKSPENGRSLSSM